MGGNEVYIRYDSGNLSITQSNCYIGRGEAMSYLVQKAFDMLKKDVGAHLIKSFTKTFHVGDWGGPDYSTSSDIPNSKVIPCPFFHGWKEANIEDYSTECLKITKQSHIPYIHSKMLWVGRLTCQARKDFIKNYSSHSKIKSSYLPEDWGHIPKLPTDYVSLSDHCKYKYLIDIEGVGYSARSKFFLHSRRPLFYQKRRWNEYWFWDLKEYKHYIPVANNLSDLDEKIEWAEVNPDKCKEIADNAADFAANNLRKKDAIKRLRDILYELGTGELNKSLFTEQTKAYNTHAHMNHLKTNLFGSIWKFIGNDTVYGIMRLNHDGTIGIYDNDNERFWEARDNTIVLMNKNKEATSILNKITDNKFEGKFSLSENMVHRLISNS